MESSKKTPERTDRGIIEDHLKETLPRDFWDDVITDGTIGAILLMMKGWPQHRKMLFVGLCGEKDIKAAAALLGKYGNADKADDTITE